MTTPHSLRAGVGKVDITCREDVTLDALLDEQGKKDLPPSLLGRKLEVSDPLYVRALVLDDGQQRLAILTMDVTAIGCRTLTHHLLYDSADDFLPRLRERVETTLGIPGGNLSVSASHTHGVPRMLCDDEAQLERATEAVRQALDNLTPVTLASGSAREDRLTFNRTMKMEDGTDWTLRSCNPYPPDELVESLRPVDPEIGILRLDRLDGTPFALVYNFATHLLLGPPNGQSGQITADHVGVTLRVLEEHLGHGAMAFFTQGSLGDVAEVSKCDTDHPRSSIDFGTRLAESVLAGWRSLAPESTPAGLRVIRQCAQLPLRTDIPAVIAELREEQAELMASLRYTTLNFKTFLPLYLKAQLSESFPGRPAYRYLQAEACGNPLFRRQDDRNRIAIQTYLASIEAMERMARNEEKIATLERHQAIIDSQAESQLEVEFQAMCIGDSLFIMAPMELLTEVGLKVKAMSPMARTFVASITNGYIHYAPPAAYYGRGGYEVTECLLAPEWEAIFYESMQAIFDEL